MLELSGKLSSFIELRKAHYSYDDYNSCLMVADAMGYIRKNNGNYYEGTENFKDRRHSNNLLRQFSEMWQMATSDPDLRNVIL